MRRGVVRGLVGATLGLAVSPVYGIALAAQEARAGLRAIVTSSETGQPIGGAVVRVGGDEGMVGWADASGRVQIGGIRPGWRPVIIEAPGYTDDRVLVNFEPSRVADVAFGLAPAPIPLEPLEVAVEGRSAEKLASAGGFEPSGAADVFLPPERAAERAERAARLSDMLRGLSRFRIVRTERGT